MLRLEPTRKSFTEAGALHTTINLFGFWNEHTFVTKSGDAGVVLRVNGMDYESLDHGARDLAVKRLEAGLRVFDEKIRIYQLLFKSQAEVVQPVHIPIRSYRRPRSSAIVISPSELTTSTASTSTLCCCAKVRQLRRALCLR